MKKPVIHVLGLLLLPVGCSHKAPEPEGGAVSQTHEALTSSYVLTIPDSFVYSGYSLGARETLRINDGAEVTGKVFNLGQGSGETNLGVNATSGSVTSGAPLVLRNGAHVTGDVRTAGAFVPPAGVVIDGDTFASEPFDAHSRTMTVDFGNQSGGSLALEPGQMLSPPPGSYQSLNVKTGATTQLSTGRYYFTSLITEPGSELRLDDVDGPVVVFVRDTLILRSTVGSIAQEFPYFFLAALTSSFVTIEGAFAGTLFAPNASVGFQVSGPFTGQAFAKKLELHQYLSWSFQPTDLWVKLLDPTESLPLEPAQEPISDALPDDEIGDAIRAYVTAVYTTTSPQARIDAAMALRQLPSGAVVAALQSAINTSQSPSYVHALVFAASDVLMEAAIPIFAGLLTMPIPDWEKSESHSSGPDETGPILLRAVKGLSFLARAGVVAARQPLLNAATQHPLRFVRKDAIWSIQQGGDTELIDDMEAGLVPGDEPLLNQGAPPPLVGLPAAGDGEPDPVAVPGPSPGGQMPAEGGTGGTGSGGGAGTGPGGTAGAGGSGSPAGCTASTAVDLGAPGNDVTVPNHGCVKVQGGYPSWWSNRTMKLETTTGGTFPAPFTWSNACSGSSGSGVFSANWQAKLLATTSASCPTLIDFQGNGSGNVTVRYWAE